jgi:hypothetical protein
LGELTHPPIREGLGEIPQVGTVGYIRRIEPPLVEIEGVSIRSEKVCEEATSYLGISKRCRRCQKSNLGRLWVKAQKMEQVSKQVRHLSAGSTSIHVKFVDNDVKHVLRVCFEPFTCHVD